MHADTDESEILTKHLQTSQCVDQEKDVDSDPVRKPNLQNITQEENFDISSPITEESTKYLCDVCLLSFSTEDELKQHRPTHKESLGGRSSILKKS